MITSDKGFLIATPTKCATTTLEAVVKRHQRQNPADHDDFRLMDWDSPRRQHRMALPPVVRDDPLFKEADVDEEWADVDRFLFVRNPFRRYMSIYTYLSAPANYSQWGAREVQRGDWGGHDINKVIEADLPRMTFEEFLWWYIDQRKAAESPEGWARRGNVEEGRAYRSPWVWTDSLSRSLGLLQQQPGIGGEDEPECLHMEDLWDELDRLSRDYGVVGLDLSPIHANRSTAYGDRGADPSDRSFWGGIGCVKRVFKGYDWAGWSGSWCEKSSCAACVLRVTEEAAVVGYL